LNETRNAAAQTAAAFLVTGAGDRTRTGDVQLGKHVQRQPIESAFDASLEVRIAPPKLPTHQPITKST